MDNWIKLFWPSFIDNSATNMTYYGVLGDYFGGFLGTLLTLISIVLLFLSWRLTQVTQKQTSTFQMVSKMIDTHEEIVASTTIREDCGREAFLHLLSDFYRIYEIVNAAQTDPKPIVLERVDIAYTFMYYGTQTVTHPELSRYKKEYIQNIADAVSRERSLKQLKKGTLKGHQNRLSHYFRNMYGTFEFIDQAPIPKRQKYALAKLYRTKLSNYEQALLCLNVISHLGRSWVDTGLMRRYQPIKNLPKGFFTFEKNEPFVLKELFPYISFEWESYSEERTSTRIFPFFVWTLVFIRKIKKGKDKTRMRARRT